MSDPNTEFAPLGYERAEPEDTFADVEINAAVDGYVATLSDEEQLAFNGAFKTVGDRVGEVCRQYGIALGGGQVSNEAVELRSLHLVRYLEGVVTRGRKEKERAYYLPILDNEFWSGVDYAAERNLGRLASEKYGVTLKPVNRGQQDVGEGQHDNEVELGTLGEYLLSRRSVGWDSYVHAVYYTARLLSPARWYSRKLR